MKTVIAGAVLALAMASVTSAQPPQDQSQGEHHHEGGGRPEGQARPQGAQPPTQGQARPQGQPGGGYQRPQGAPAQAAPAQAAPAAPFQPGRTGGRTFPGGQGGYRSGVQPNGAQGPTFPGGQGGFRSGAQPGRPAYGSQGAPNPGAQGGVQGQFGQRGDDRGRSFEGQRFDGGRPGYGGRYDDRGGRPGGGFSYRGRTYESFRVAPFRFPRGYSYRPYRVHERLPLLFLGSSFFLNDYGSYYLAPPPSPEFRWVRYGPDALLVDTYSGEVVDAAYGVFDDGSGYYGDEGYPRYTQPNPY